MCYRCYAWNVFHEDREKEEKNIFCFLKNGGRRAFTRKLDENEIPV
jgi:hypothetical protein